MSASDKYLDETEDGLVSVSEVKNDAKDVVNDADAKQGASVEVAEAKSVIDDQVDDLLHILDGLHLDAQAPIAADAKEVIDLTGDDIDAPIALPGGGVLT